MAKKSVDLPEELITEILLRLTVKTLLHCKCVCKLWRSLISNPHFATSHFQLADSPTIKLFCLGNNSETLSIDFNASLNNESSYASRSYEFLPRRLFSEFGGSCRGFMFFLIWSDFYMWNPSTGVQRKISVSPITIVPKADFDTILFGFAYNHSNDDYLIVLIYCYCRAFYSPTSGIGLEIFSLRANKWKRIEISSHFPYSAASKYVDVSRAGLLLNGAIHWMVYNHDTSKAVIIALNLKEMTMSEIALPDNFRATDYPYKCGMSILGGLISAWSVEMYTVKIWVMQKYAVHSSWTKTLVFSRHPVPYFSPICFTNCGHIIGSDGKGGLVKFNDKGQLLEHHPYSYGNCYFNRSQMGVYTESMLSLPGGTEQP